MVGANCTQMNIYVTNPQFVCLLEANH